MFAFAKRRSVKFYFTKNKRHIPNGICLLFLAERMGRKLNVGAPTPDNLKFWEFNPPE